MTTFSGKPLSSKTANAACSGPQGGGMDSRRITGVAEVSSTYPADIASKSIPVGYKQTEVGVIPEDWFIEPLEKFTSFISYGFTNPMPTTHVGPYMITARDISDGKIQYKNARTTDIDAFNKLLTSKSRPKKNDLLLTKDGTLGRLALAEDEQICINQSVAILRPNQRIVPLFFKLLLESPYYQERMIEEAGGSTIKHIYITIVNRMPLSVPSDTKEQAAIANALSDVDALIGELEKLIAKKQAIKTGTMQQLLTGRTRLPPFALREDGTPTNSPGTNLDAGAGGPKGEGQDGLRKSTKPSELGEIPEDWEVVPFGNTLAIRHGKNQKAVEKANGTIPIFATGGQIGWADQYLWNKPSVLIGRKGTIDKPRYADQPFWTVDTLFYSEIKDCADPKFIFYKFCMIDWMQYNEASGVPSLNASTIERVLASLPPKEEQTAIATILSDMDAEIQALEQRLSKTRQIKQGMMQELLTGKTRLPYDKE